jgi:hypothetical protein
MITKEHFNEVKEIILAGCDTHKDEYYTSERYWMETVFDKVEASYFMDEEEARERAELKRLLEKYRYK